jgi:hypothetical protein
MIELGNISITFRNTFTITLRITLCVEPLKTGMKEDENEHA